MFSRFFQSGKFLVPVTFFGLICSCIALPDKFEADIAGIKLMDKVYYFQDFEGEAPKLDKCGRKEERATKAIVVDLEGRASGKIASGKALRMDGGLLWIVTQLTFDEPVTVPADAMLMASVLNEGHGGGKGIAINLISESEGQSYNRKGMGKHKERPGWEYLIANVGDFFPGKKEIRLVGLKIAQRVDGGYEKPGFKGAPHTFFVDNIIIASGKAGEEIKKVSEHFGGIRYYKGPRSFVLAENADSTIWHSPSDAKVFRDQVPPSAEGKEVEISGCRGEGESFQLVLNSRKGMKDVSLELSELKGPGGSAIKTDALRWYPVLYKKIRVRYFYWAMPSEWPLMLSWNRTIDVSAGKNQPFWVTVNIPKGIAAGDYSGKVKVKSGAEILAEVPVTLKVYGFDFPESPAFRSNIQVWDKYLKSFYPDVRKTWTDMHLILAKEYKMYDANKFMKNPRAVRQELVKLGQNAIKLPFCGGHRGGAKMKLTKLDGCKPFSEGYEKAFTKLLKRERKRYSEMGLEKKCFLYLWDEPFGDFDVIKMVRWMGEVAKKAWPGIETYMAGPYVPALAGYVDIYLEHYTCPRLIREAQKKGVTFWWWGNDAFNADLSGIDMRAKFGVESLQRNIPGAYAWGAAVWRGEADYSELGNPWEVIDRAQDNAVVLYPGGTEFSKSEKIVRTTTLEINRDGIEDYEYGCLLKKIAADTKDANLKKEAQDALDALISSVKPVWMYNRENFDDVDRLEKARKKAALLLEKAVRKGELK